MAASTSILLLLSSPWVGWRLADLSTVLSALLMSVDNYYSLNIHWIFHLTGCQIHEFYSLKNTLNVQLSLCPRVNVCVCLCVFKMRLDSFHSTVVKFEDVRQLKKFFSLWQHFCWWRWLYTFFSVDFSTSWGCCKDEINGPESQNLYMEESGIFWAQEALWVPTLDFLSRIVHHYRRQNFPRSLCSNRVRQHFLFALSAETNN